jgi:hypothetical protein
MQVLHDGFARNDKMTKPPTKSNNNDKRPQPKCHLSFVICHLSLPLAPTKHNSKDKRPQTRCHLSFVILSFRRPHQQNDKMTNDKPPRPTRPMSLSLRSPTKVDPTTTPLQTPNNAFYRPYYNCIPVHSHAFRPHSRNPTSNFTWWFSNLECHEMACMCILVGHVSRP